MSVASSRGATWVVVVCREMPVATTSTTRSGISVGPSDNQRSRMRDSSRSSVMPIVLRLCCPSLGVEGGAHGAMGVVESRAHGPRRSAESSAISARL